MELALLDAWSKEYDTPIYDALKKSEVRGQRSEERGIGKKEPQHTLTEPVSNIQHPESLQSQHQNIIASEHPITTSPHHHIKSSIPYSGVIPFGNIEKLKPLLSCFNFQKIKIKVGNDLKENIKRIQAIQEIYGLGIPIRVDANCAWTFDEALRQIPTLIKLGVKSFEQIFLVGKEMEKAKITRLFGNQVLIMADESLCSFADAKYLIENKCCNAFNLKISKNGGILNTLEIYNLALKHDIPCQLGAHFGETSILTTAGIILSALAPKLIAHEGGLGTILLEQDICEFSIKIDKNGIIKTKSVLDNIGLSSLNRTVSLKKQHQPTPINRNSSNLSVKRLNL